MTGPSTSGTGASPPRVGRDADRVVSAYGDRADEYSEVLGSMHAVRRDDRTVVEEWAADRQGLLVDVGCGPGHWTAHLAGRGHDVIGFDPVPRFVALARAAAPDVDFRLGTVEATGLPAGTVAGVLSWYSLVHHDPERVPDALAEVRRILAPGGGLLIGFFEGPTLEPFDHAVTTAYRWPVARMAAVLEATGFAVDAVHRRTDEGARPHAAVVAHRR